MMFTALTSANIVRAASSNDWRPIAMPKILLLSTALIIASSGTLVFARRKLKAAFEGKYKVWLLLTTGLGAAFVVDAGDCADAATAVKQIESEKMTRNNCCAARNEELRFS